MTQKQAISILKTGANVFLTGEPGSGKTYTANEYIKYLREHEMAPAVTASTGIAATHLGGMTIHSWSGIGIRKQLTKRDLGKLCSSKRLISRARKTSVLVIDEISMLSSSVLSVVDLALKTLRENDRPFGGMQVVFVGDFFQLPPVTGYSEPTAEFAFESPSWQSAKPVVCYLSEQYRQKDDQFLSLLSAIRSGKKDPSVYSTLHARKSQESKVDTHTRLYSHNIDVDRINHKKLATLTSDEYEFEMRSKGPKKLVEQLKKGCLSPGTLALKVGCQVMFTKNNFEMGFVNGTLGKVIKLTDKTAPVVQTKDGRTLTVLSMEWIIDDGLKTLATISQIPLRLAWAITVHKSQGMTLDTAVINLSTAFEYGQGYVAISRVKTLAGLFLEGFNQRALEVHPEILTQDKVFRKKSQKALWYLNTLSTQEIKDKYKKFILKCGGSVKTIKLKPKGRKRESTYDTTLNLIKEGVDIDQIAKRRDLKRETIISHLERLYDNGKISNVEIKTLAPKTLKKSLSIIQTAFDKHGIEYLSPIYHALDKKYSYGELKLARILIEE